VTHNDVSVEKVINIDQNSDSQTAMESVWPVSKSSTESVRSRCELVANSVHTVDAYACRRRRCVLGIGPTPDPISILGSLLVESLAHVC